MAELHPQCRAFLDLDPDAPELWKISVYEGRAGGHTPVDFSGPIDHSVKMSHRYFTGPTADLPITIYRPEGEGPFNGMVYFHGGGWVFNDISKYDAQLTAMAKLTNSVIVSVNYQKAPEHKFPIPFNDCYAAFEWTVAHASELEINPAKIGIGGDSAGGNLASAVALKIRDVGKDHLAYQWLIYPCNGVNFETPSYIQNATGYGLTKAAMIWLWEQYLNDEADRANPYAVPLNATDYSGLAPAVIITAGFDPLHDDGEIYKEKLVAAGVPVAFRDYPGMIHGFFNYGSYIDEGITVREYFAEEINRILGDH